MLSDQFAGPRNKGDDSAKRHLLGCGIRMQVKPCVAKRGEPVPVVGSWPGPGREVKVRKLNNLLGTGFDRRWGWPAGFSIADGDLFSHGPRPASISTSNMHRTAVATDPPLEVGWRSRCADDLLIASSLVFSPWYALLYFHAHTSYLIYLSFLSLTEPR